MLCIDIAIPSKRIGFEICGQSNYIWPSGEINVKTKFKQYILEKLKWEIHIIKFDPTANTEKR
jgi:hypothetical protein